MRAPATATPVRTGFVVPWLTLYVVVLFAIPSRLVFGPLGSAGAPSMIVGLASALLWFLAQLWRSTPHDAPRQPIRIALGLFLACMGISYALAMAGPIEYDEVSPADVALVVAVSWSGVLLVAHDGIGDKYALTTLVRRFALAGGLMAAVGLAQILTSQVLIDRIEIPGLTATGAVEASFRNGLLRMSGTATSPIEFGALLAILLPLAVHNAMHPSTRNPIARWLPVLSISLGLALSLSRSAYIALLVVFVVLLVGWPSRLRWRAVGVVVVTAGALAVASPRLFRSVRSMFATVDEDPSIASRTNSYDMVWQFFVQSPWFGRGPGTFLPKYRILDNNYLGLLINMGLVGLLTFTAILVTAIVVLIRARRRWQDPRARDLALSLTAGIAAGAISLAFFDGFAFPMTMGTLFLCLGLAGALVRLHRENDAPVVAGGATHALHEPSSP